MNSTMLVSNSILNKAFSVDKYITPRQLNDILLTASDKYFLATGGSFLLEKPMIGYDGQSWYYSVIDRYYLMDWMFVLMITGLMDEDDS